jgi:predicted metal-dependent phosphoesterase TrpH
LLTPEEKVRIYMSMGLNGAAFTDHWNIDGGLAAQKYVQEQGLNFTVILGQEYSGRGLHLNFFGINESIVG